jgi:ABC-2 type transport system permease protein
MDGNGTAPPKGGAAALLRFTAALMTTSLRASAASRAVFALQIAFMAMNNLTFFVFWWILFARVPAIRGWRLDDVEALFGVGAIGVGLVEIATGGLRRLARTIHTGELDVLLTQPKPVLLYATGLRSQASGIGDVSTGMCLLALSGYVRWSTLPIAMIVIVAGAVVFFATGVIFFSLAFWLGKTETLSRQLWDVLVTFALYPDPVFGGVTRVALFTVLPAGFITFLPVRAIRDASVVEAAFMVVAAAAYLGLAVIVFDRGLKRYASGNRFTVMG